MSANEPVAWMNSLVKWDIAVEQDITHDIPLYTHPAKTLTNTEVIDLAGKYFNQQDWDAVGFYEAILRKAQ